MLVNSTGVLTTNDGRTKVVYVLMYAYRSLCHGL